ncbi:MAG: hypothetical protein ACLUTA_16305 [Blautia wexlerae]
MELSASAQIGRTRDLIDAVEAHDTDNTGTAVSEFTSGQRSGSYGIILKQSGDDIDVVYCENDNEALGAIDAIEAAGDEVGGEEGQILVMSSDTQTLVLQIH